MQLQTHSTLKTQHGQLRKLSSNKSFRTYNALSRHCKQEDTVTDVKNVEINTPNNQNKGINVAFYWVTQSLCPYGTQQIQHKAVSH